MRLIQRECSTLRKHDESSSLASELTWERAKAKYIYIYDVGNFSQIWGNLDPWTTLNMFIYKKYLISLMVVVLVRACWRYSLHSGIMHFSTCSSSARHWEPSDAGIFIILALFFIPTPQLTLHGSQSAHSVTIQLLGASTCNTHTHMLLATKYGTKYTLWAILSWSNFLWSE